MEISRNLKKVLVCGASLAIIASLGSGVSNVSARRVHRYHYRTVRMYRHHRKYRRARGHKSKRYGRKRITRRHGKKRVRRSRKSRKYGKRHVSRRAKKASEANHSTKKLASISGDKSASSSSVAPSNMTSSENESIIDSNADAGNSQMNAFAKQLAQISASEDASVNSQANDNETNNQASAPSTENTSISNNNNNQSLEQSENDDLNSWQEYVNSMEASHPAPIAHLQEDNPDANMRPIKATTQYDPTNYDYSITLYYPNGTNETWDAFDSANFGPDSLRNYNGYKKFAKAHPQEAYNWLLHPDNYIGADSGDEEDVGHDYTPVGPGIPYHD